MRGLCFGSGEGEEWDSPSWIVDAPVWQAGLAVLDEPWRGYAPPRVMLLVIVERNVVHEELLPVAEVGEAPDAARALGRAVHALAAKAGGYPQTLMVRDRGVAARLEPALARHGTRVRVSTSLRRVHHMIRHLAGLLDEPDFAWDLFPVGAGYGRARDPAPDPALARALFHAAARFYRARPWEGVPDGKRFRSRREGRKSLVVLTHPKGHGHAITLFTRALDYDGSGWDFPKRPVLGIRFVARHAVPRDLRRRIAAEGWEVAAPGAHPLLVADDRVLDRGASAADVRHLTSVMEALSERAETSWRAGAG
jgi:hypothetical protein